MLAAQVEREAQGVALLTFASDGTRCELRRLRESASHHGIDLEVLGVGQAPWSNGIKLRLLQAHLRERGGSLKDALVCVVDGYDVVFAGTEQELLLRYRRLTSRAAAPAAVVFSADHTFYFAYNATSEKMQDEYARAYPTAPTIYRFLNSGSFMGPAHQVLALVDAVLSLYGDGAGWDLRDDQTLFHRMFVDQQTLRASAMAVPEMILDYWQEAFANTGGRQHEGDLGITGGRLHNRVTDSHPVVLHCPGAESYQAEIYGLSAAGWSTPIVACG